MNTALTTEEAWLEQLRSSKLIGICMIDADGRPIQQYIDDPALRLIVIDYQTERVRLLRLDERRLATQAEPVLCPLPKDALLVSDAKQMPPFDEVFEYAKTRQLNSSIAVSQ